MHEHFFEIGKYRIHYKYFAENKNNAVILLVHGHGEHLNRYESWAQNFNQYNYAVCALDLPGHGKSSGQRGHISNFDDYYEILDTFLEKVNHDFPNRPIIIYGHSMGGNIVASYLIDRKPIIHALVLSSPWIELAIQPPAFRFWLAKTMYKIFPSFGDRTKLDAKFISRIPDEVQKYMKDPLVHDKITPGLFIPMFFKGIKLINASRKIYVPTLIFHGTGDMLTSHKASFKFSEGNEKIDFKSYEGGSHELHNDLCRDQLHEDILDWLAAKVIMR